MPNNWHLDVLVLVAGLVSTFLDLREPRQPQDVIKHAFTVVPVLGMLIAFADQYIWRIAIGRRRFAVPNLRGTCEITAATHQFDAARNGNFRIYVALKPTRTNVRLTVLWGGGKTSIIDPNRLLPMSAHVRSQVVTGSSHKPPYESSKCLSLSCTLPPEVS
jgi:hypothetical protein